MYDLVFTLVNPQRQPPSGRAGVADVAHQRLVLPSQHLPAPGGVRLPPSFAITCVPPHVCHISIHVATALVAVAPWIAEPEPARVSRAWAGSVGGWVISDAGLVEHWLIGISDDRNQLRRPARAWLLTMKYGWGIISERRVVRIDMGVSCYATGELWLEARP